MNIIKEKIRNCEVPNKRVIEHDRPTQYFIYLIVWTHNFNYIILYVSRF